MVLPKSLTTVTTFSKTIALILFILLPFAGFYLGYKYREGTYMTVPMVKNNLSSNPTPDETVNWKVYGNQELGFELRYPPNWAFRLQSRTFVSPRKDSFAISNNSNNKEWLAVEVVKEITGSLPNQGFSSMPFTGAHIGGLPALTYEIPHPGEDVAVPKLGPYVGIWVQKNNKIYVFVFYNTEKVDGVYDQILSTFRFD